MHFGAGNIGRGFVAQFLHASGYQVIFADVSDDLIGARQARSSFTVTEVGEGGKEHVVDNYRAINSHDHEDEVVEAIAAADIVTTAVGARILAFVAPVVAKALAARTRSEPTATEWLDQALIAIACENAINGTSILEAEVKKHNAAENAIFANCAIDRIVPEQDSGIDVTIETFHEWAVDRTPLGGSEPDIYGITWVDDLGPFIERKLYTVNTAHAATAYHGEKHGFKDEEQAYIEKTLKRISNPALPDTCVRVGRSPMRKLSRTERFIGPAAQLAERGHAAPHLLKAALSPALRRPGRPGERRTAGVAPQRQARCRARDRDHRGRLGSPALPSRRRDRRGAAGGDRLTTTP